MQYIAYAQPIAVRNAADGSNRLFIVGRNGQVWIRSAAGTMLSTPFLNIGPGGTAPPSGLTRRSRPRTHSLRSARGS